jgi:hypothetical protein
MFDFDVVTGPSPAERAALERARSETQQVTATLSETAPTTQSGGTGSAPDEPVSST